MVMSGGIDMERKDEHFEKRNYQSWSQIEVCQDMVDRYNFQTHNLQLLGLYSGY
jgi:ribulose 1,5-bisphosphate carboxylase large subunit-like protein